MSYEHALTVQTRPHKGKAHLAEIPWICDLTDAIHMMNRKGQPISVSPKPSIDRPYIVKKVTVEYDLNTDTPAGVVEDIFTNYRPFCELVKTEKETQNLKTLCRNTIDNFIKKVQILPCKDRRKMYVTPCEEKFRIKTEKHTGKAHLTDITWICDLTDAKNMMKREGRPIDVGPKPVKRVTVEYDLNKDTPAAVVEEIFTYYPPFCELVKGENETQNLKVSFQNTIDNLVKQVQILGHEGMRRFYVIPT